MAEFTYKSRIYGDCTFSVEDLGGVVVYKGKQLSHFGGYLQPGSGQRPLRADASTLEAVARRWWKHRTDHLAAFGHKANGVEP